MSYQADREEFIAIVTREGLPVYKARILLTCATTINRLAELACGSEAADRDRIPCPASVWEAKHLSHGPIKPSAKHPCLCDSSFTRAEPAHTDIPRIRLQDYRAEQRAIATVPAGWRVITEGDPRGYTLRVIPPSYAAENAGKDRHNLRAIGVPPGPSRLRW